MTEERYENIVNEGAEIIRYDNHDNKRQGYKSEGSDVSQEV